MAEQRNLLEDVEPLAEDPPPEPFPPEQELGNPVNQNEGDGDAVIVEGPEEPAEQPRGGCCKCCIGCCDKCSKQCRQDCSTQGFITTTIHVLIFLISLMVSVVATYSKQKNFGMCLLEAQFNKESGGYSFPSKTSVSCDYTLYYGLCSSALAFLCIMVTWVAGLHKTHRWHQAQVVIHAVALLGKLVASMMQTVGFFLWCDRLNTALKCSPEESCPSHRENRNCQENAAAYDSQREDATHKMEQFFYMVLVTMSGNWFTFLLWLVATVAVTIRLIQPREDLNEDDDDDDDDDDDEDDDDPLDVAPVECQGAVNPDENQVPIEANQNHVGPENPAQQDQLNPDRRNGAAVNEPPLMAAHGVGANPQIPNQKGNQIMVNADINHRPAHQPVNA